MNSEIHSNDPRFVSYYAEESLTARAAERAENIMRTVLRVRASFHDSAEDLLVADIGCNAGTQSRCWLRAGHRACGVDIGSELVDLARSRNAEFGERASFEVGSAIALPWESNRFDVCLLPELLEHVDDWKLCLSEAVRVIKPGGTLFLSTTNVLCPTQQEFELPGYSWYPAPLKRYFVKRARTDSPKLANYATYPAVNWFSPYRLKRVLATMDVDALDRFDVMEPSNRGPLVRFAIGMARVLPPVRLAGHLLSQSTVLIGRKSGAASGLL